MAFVCQPPGASGGATASSPSAEPTTHARGSSFACLKAWKGIAKNCVHRAPREGAPSSPPSPPPFSPGFGSSTTRRSTTRRIDAVGAPGGRKLRAGDWWGCGPSAPLESRRDPVRAGRRGGRQAGGTCHSPEALAGCQPGEARTGRAEGLAPGEMKKSAARQHPWSAYCPAFQSIPVRGCGGGGGGESREIASLARARCWARASGILTLQG